MRTPLLVLAVGLLGPALAPAGAAAEQEHGFLDRTYRYDDGKEPSRNNLNGYVTILLQHQPFAAAACSSWFLTPPKESKYTLFVPYDYQGDKPYPLIVYLHGSGEGGTDGKKPANVGLGPAVRKQEKTFPFLALFPQSHNGQWNTDSEDAKRVIAILDDVQKTYQVDLKRVFLTGMSSGGDGAWNLAVAYPERWAAILPVCGNGDPAAVAKIKDVPCWYFMGSADNKAWVDNAHEMIKALKDVGADPQYTEYPGMGHGIWNKVYGAPELYDWLLKQCRK